MTAALIPFGLPPGRNCRGANASAPFFHGFPCVRQDLWIAPEIEGTR